MNAVVVPHWTLTLTLCCSFQRPSLSVFLLLFAQVPSPPPSSFSMLPGEPLLAIQDSAQTGTLLRHSHILSSPYPPPLCATSPSYTHLSLAVHLVLPQCYGPSPASPTPLGFLRLKHILIWVPGSQHIARHTAVIFNRCQFSLLPTT